MELCWVPFKGYRSKIITFENEAVIGYVEIYRVIFPLRHEALTKLIFEQFNR
jgi:hypothetical protein